MPEQQGGNDDKDLGLDWLAAQLNDGDDEAAAEPDEDAADDTAAGAEADARPDSAPTVALPVAPVVVPPVAPPADAPTAPPAPVAERAAPERPAAQVPSPDPAPAGGDTAPAPTAPAEPASGGFRWGLTPSIEPDPAVDAARRTPPAQAAPETPVVPAAAPPVPAAAAPRPAATPPAATPAAPAAAAPAPAAPVPAAPVPAAPVPAAPAPAADPEPTQPLTKTPAPPKRSPADLEAAPWWTTPAQSRLVPTAEEETAALGRRTPAAPPSPLDTGVAPRTTAAADSATAPVSRHSSHEAVPLPEPAPAGLPVSAATAAAATGAATAAPGHDAHVAPAPSADEPGPRRRGPADGGPPRRPTKRDLRWVGGAVIAVLVIIGLFFLGQSLGDTPVAAPTESASAEPDASTAPTPAPEPAAPGPQPAGVHAWNTLFGTECLEPYTSPWEEEFTVVDCATPHTGQLVYRGILEGDSGSPFPGEQAFADQINVLCSAPGVIDFEAAGAYADVQLQGSYPVTAEQWDAGERYFYCFASRSSGEPLTASLSPAA